MMRRTPTRLVAIAAFALCCGCFASQRPPALTTEEKAVDQAGPLPYSVTVAWWGTDRKGGQKPSVYAEQVFKLLEASNAFRSVRYEPTSEPAPNDLVATSAGLYFNTAAIPLLTIITVGIIPTVFKDEECQGVVIRSGGSGSPGQPVPVAVRYKGRVVMGWAAAFMGLLPGWSYGSVRDDSRLADRLRVEILRRRREIDAVAKP
jgi:hypothetical protein